MSGYSYAESPDPYCYEGTTVLINKLNIRDGAKLSDTERRVTSAKELGLIKNPIRGRYGFTHFKNIHKHLFQDLYEWAGVPRTAGFISKGDSIFCVADHIDSYANQIFGRLAAEKKLKNLSHDAFCLRLAYYASELNVLHPFREGNGRTTRTFLQQLAAQAGYRIYWQLTTREELLHADIAAFNVQLESLTAIYSRIVKPLN